MVINIIKNKNLIHKKLKLSQFKIENLQKNN